MTGDRGFGRGQHPEELLSASLSGDVSPSERVALDAHLASCAQCRETLNAFAEERRLIAGLREVTPPRDLGARVRAGIEGRGTAAMPWWRRPATLVGFVATLTTVTAALLAIVVFSNVDPGPVANDPSATATPLASEDIQPTATQLPSVAPTAQPTEPPPAVALEPGQIGYLQLDGEPTAPLALSFVNEATGEVTDLGTASAAPWTAAISPTNEFVAYTVDIGLSGAQQLRVTRLSDGMTEVLGCTVPRAFADRLVWSDDGRYLGYTLTPIDLGDSVDCGGVTGDGTRTDAWMYDAGASAVATQLTDDGNSFAADMLAISLPGRDGADEAQYALMVSHAATTPWTELVGIGFSVDQEPLQNVFLPLLSPDGERALFWRGEMEQVSDGGWHFLSGGMPYRSGEPVDGQPSWSGEPLFTDLQPIGGAAFESGQFGWSPDGTLVGFWLGEWTGAPQSADGTYPSSRDVYVGRAAEGLSKESRIALQLEELQGVVNVTLDHGTGSALVTVVQPAAGDLAVPASTLYAVPIAGGDATILGTGASWTGPAVIGLEAKPVAP